MIRKTLFLFFILFSANVFAGNKDYSGLLAGKHLILEGATCAGIVFEDKTRAFLVPELNCLDMLETRVRWIRPDLFVLTETEVITEKCPPRNWIYEIQSMEKDHIKIRSYWTGWNNLDDSTSDYKITENEILEE